MNAIQELEQQLGIKIEQQANVTTVRQFHAKCAYCCNEREEIIALAIIETEIESIHLPASFQSLQYLNLGNNAKLKNLTFGGGLPHLEHLDVGDSNLESLTLAQSCNALRYVDASRNRLKSFVPLGDFPDLVHLDLSNNQLADFDTHWLSKFPTLKRIYLKGNDKLYTSKRKGVEQSANCLSFLQRFHRDLEKGEAVKNDEYKLLVVGNGGVGKSCLIAQLVHEEFRPNHDSTHGISIEPYPKNEQFPYTLNIWDFGGQDIYHATHRLFMQSNAIYYILWDKEVKENQQHKIIEHGYQRAYEDYKLSYWLYYVQQQGKNSPAIVIRTKKAENDAPHQEEAQLKAIFKGKFSKPLDFHAVESSERDWQKNGFNRLLYYTKEAIEHLGRTEKLPEGWAKIRQHLRNLHKNAGTKVLSLSEYEEIASDYDLENPMEVLETWLVPAGVVFYRKGYFEDTILLDQAWAIRAIYTLFERKDENWGFHKIRSQNGVFSGAELRKIWRKHGEVECQLFLKFMLSCELCFEIEEKEERQHHKPFEERQFVAPQMMKEDAPALIEEFEDHNPDRLFVRYEHSLLHYGIIQSFIIRTQYLAEKKDIWKNGILIKEKGTSVLVRKIGDSLQIELPPHALSLLAKTRNLLKKLQLDEVGELLSTDGKKWVKASLLNESKSDYVPTTCNDAVPRADFEVFLDRTFTQDTFDDSAKENNDSAILLKQFEKEQLTKEAILSDVPRALDFDSEDEISILFLAANPSSSSRISWEKEQTAVAERIDSTKCKTTPVSGITLDDLIDAVEDHEPNIIHFVGHGTAVEIDKEGNPTKAGLLLHHNRAGKEIIETATLKRQFAAFKDDNPALQLVFLNACHSSEQAKAISEVGLITVGTSDEIISEVAQKFAVGFYRWLSKHPAVDVLVAMKKGMNRAASSSEPIKELIHIYSNGVKIYPS